jgi:hypothetical protein
MTATAYTRSLSETQMRLAITEAVERIGGRVFYVHDSRYAPAMTDFPDLVIILPSKGTVAFVELKSWTRTITDGQRAVLDMLDHCRGAESFIVRSEAKDVHDVGYQQFMDWLTA